MGRWFFGQYNYGDWIYIVNIPLTLILILILQHVIYSCAKNETKMLLTQTENLQYYHRGILY
jgi:hypothetical protein